MTSEFKLSLENILLIGLAVGVLFYMFKPSLCGNQKTTEDKQKTTEPFNGWGNLNYDQLKRLQMLR